MDKTKFCPLGLITYDYESNASAIAEPASPAA